MARGSSPPMSSRWGAAERSSGSKTSTVFAWEHDTKARWGVPAKTTSVGSSSVDRVARTLRLFRSTTLMLSDTWLTTHASRLVRARTETGSSPTTTENAGARDGPPVRSTSSRLSGVLTASRSPPSGVASSGLTWGDSQLTKDCAETTDTRARDQTATRGARDMVGPLEGGRT